MELSFIVAVVAAYFAYQARSRAKELATRLGRLEAVLDQLEGEVSRLTGRAAPTAPRVAPESSPKEQDAVPQIPLPSASSDEKAPKAADDAIKATSGGDGGGTSVPPTAGGALPPSSPSAPGLEERLGTRWAVWAGGLALALGGLLLVRFSIEAGLLGPGVRVMLGALLAAALIGGGEYLRRTELKLPIEAIPDAHVPSILTAAGTVVAFGTIYAAHALYGLIGSAAAFTLLGATAIGTMLAAAIHGPWLAGLGLLGAYFTPMLVSSDTPNPWPVVLYLAAVASAAYALARLRSWAWLGWGAVAGAAVWGAFLIEPATLEASPWLHAAAVHGLVQLGLAAFFLSIEPSSDTKDADAYPEKLTIAALAAVATTLALLLADARLDVGTRQLILAGALIILGATAWRAASAAAAAAIGGVLVLVLQLGWPALTLPPDPTLTPPDAEYMLRLPENISAFLAYSIVASLAIFAVGALRLWRSPRLPISTAAIYGGAAAATPLLALVVSYLRVTQFDASIPYALAGGVLGLGFAYVAERMHQANSVSQSPAYNVGAGIFAAAAIAAIAFAFFAVLERGYLTVVLALAALGTAYIARLRDIPVLRYAVSAIGLVVLARVLWNPRIMGDTVGTTPIFNWLLLGYGVPAVSFALSARWLERLGDSLAVRLSDSLAVIFTALLVFFQIRHLTNGGDVLSPSSSLVEMGLLTLMSILLSFALARLNGSKRNWVFDIASLVFGAGTALLVLFGLFVFQNPLLTGERITNVFGFNELTLSYLLPGLAALFAARHARGIRPQSYVRGAGILAVLLIFAYVTLEVRRAFHGPGLSLSFGTTDAEQWAYSVAWLLLGVAFLAYGLWRGSLEARIASAALIVLSALKVTLFDLAGLDGLWRALSFLCLGAVLIGIGLVYQKLIFARPAAPPPEQPA